MEESIVAVQTEKRPRTAYKEKANMWRSAALMSMTAFLFVIGWLFWTIKTNIALREYIRMNIGLTGDIK